MAMSDQNDIHLLAGANNNSHLNASRGEKPRGLTVRPSNARGQNHDAHLAIESPRPGSKKIVGDLRGLGGSGGHSRGQSKALG